MIVTVTLNPMLDKTVSIDRLQPGRIHRAEKVEMVVGGKGVNVSRQLTRLGVETIATGFLGGEIGEMMERLLKGEGIDQEFVRVRGMTREGVTYREQEGSWTAVFEPPHPVTAGEADALVEQCDALCAEGDWLVLAGSSPCPESDEVFARLSRLAFERGVAVLLDSYGTAFRSALAGRPTFVKCNRQEYRSTMGEEIREESGIRRALSGFSDLGVRYSLVTDGEHPGYAASEGRQWKLVPPPIRAVNQTGSGDSMTAGMLFVLEQGGDFADALRFGVAAGAANAMKWEVSNSTLSEIEGLTDRVQIEQLK